MTFFLARPRLWLVLAPLAVLVWAFAIEPRLLVITRHTLEDDRLAGLKLAFVSDLHFKPGNSSLISRMTRAVMAEKPDLILLGGDYISRRGLPAPDFMSELHGLHAPLGVFAVLGNHDIIYRKQVHDALERAGITLLVNQSVPLSADRGIFWLAGVDDMIRGRPDAEKALQGTEAPVIMLSHHPEIFATTAPDTRVRLVLAGHSHGGQLRLPFLGPPLSNVAQGYIYGLSEKQGLHLLVSGGVGTSIIPARFLRPPEVVVLEFTARAKTGAGGGKE